MQLVGPYSFVTDEDWKQPAAQRLRGNYTWRSETIYPPPHIIYCGAPPWVFGMFCRLTETEYVPYRASGAGDLDWCFGCGASSLASCSPAIFTTCSVIYTDGACIPSDWEVVLRDWAANSSVSPPTLRINASWVSAISDEPPHRSRHREGELAPGTILRRAFLHDLSNRVVQACSSVFGIIRYRQISRKP